MSVQPGPTFKRYAANGVATVYTIPFLLLDAADLQVTLNGALITSGFTLAGIGNPTSSCTFSVAPTGDLLFQQMAPFQRLADYQNNGDFLAGTVNRDFDRLWLAIKQVSRDSGRALTVSALEPEGIPPLPAKDVRSLKMLVFDVNGAPATSNLTLAQIEQQPALALESAAAAAASADAAAVSSNSAAGAASSANASKIAAAISAQAAADTGLQLGMSAWGYRLQPFAGFALDDGQELERALYPDFAAAIDSGLWPRVTEAQWQADPSVRGCYVANSSPGKFRMRDLNGMSPGSIGAAFLRGGGPSGNGVIRRDQMQSHRHQTTQAFTDASANTPWAKVDGYTIGAPPVQGLTSQGAQDGAQRALSGLPYATTTPIGGQGARSGDETFPTHATGAWMTRLFGVITPLGSAEASSLATGYASIASRVSSLEFGYISPNQTWVIGGTIAVPHGLGSTPLRTAVEAECFSADAGYSVGAIVDLGANQCLVSGANSFGFSTEMSSSQLVMNIAAQGVAITHKSTRAITGLTPASWRLRLKAGKS